MKYEIIPMVGTILFFVFILSLPVAWITHVVNCIQSSEWVFLLAGAIMAPIGIVHGYGLWIGFW